MRTRRVWRPALLLGLLLLSASSAASAKASASTPSPGGFADGAFCTYGKGYFANSTEAAQRIQGGLPFSIGASPNAYSWTAVAPLQQAVGAGGSPGAFSTSATNPTDMGTGGNLAAQTLAESLNMNFSERVVTPTGFNALSLVDMDGVKLDGVRVTSTQASALNGQAAVQIREAANVALGGGALPYGLSFGQLTDLIDVLNSSFSDPYKDANRVTQPCGHPSKFAQTHTYQPYVTSNAFAGQRPASISLFAPKPPYNTFTGEVVHVGRGCPANSFVVPGSPPGSPPNNPEDPYPANPAGKIALIERGSCLFVDKIARAQRAGATGVIVYNSVGGGEALIVMGGTPSVPITIPAAFVQRSTGLLLAMGTLPGSTVPVTAFVQQ